MTLKSKNLKYMAKSVVYLEWKSCKQLRALQTKVTSFTINTPYPCFAMLAFVFCLLKVSPMCNFVVSEVGHWSYGGMRSFSGFCFNWRSWWSPYRPGNLNSLSICKWRCKWNWELQQWKLGFLRYVALITMTTAQEPCIYLGNIDTVKIEFQVPSFRFDDYFAEGYHHIC